MEIRTGRDMLVRDRGMRAQTKKLGSYNAEKLEPGVCIRLHYKEIQDGDGVEDTTNAECDSIIVPHSGTI